MKRIRLTMAQALVKFFDNQFVALDCVEHKFVRHIFGVFGHGCVVGVGQALAQGDHSLTFLQGKNEQNMALAAMAYAKQKNRLEIIPCVSSIGPGAMNMVTAAACATANRIPLLLLPGDTFASRQPDPVLQQAEFFDSFSTTVTDAFRHVCHYWDRIQRPEQLMTAAMHAVRVLTDPADTGAVCLALPQDVEGEAYDYPVAFFEKRVWHIDRRPLSQGQLERAADIIRAAKKPLLIVAAACAIVRRGRAGRLLPANGHPLFRNAGRQGHTAVGSCAQLGRHWRHRRAGRQYYRQGGRPDHRRGHTADGLYHVLQVAVPQGRPGAVHQHLRV